MRNRKLQASWVLRDSFLDVRVKVDQTGCAFRKDLGWTGNRLTHLADKVYLRLIGR